jgi:hypothetical protein
MNTSSKWILLSFAMGTGVGAGGAGACAPAAWKEEGSPASAWTPDPTLLWLISELPGRGKLFHLAFHVDFCSCLISNACEGLGNSGVAQSL